ncbi:MAG: malate dehydrogenase [Candidatus Riflebacteria bacterium RBG_13_59_9]|nr:MAG: malate dehydrogenase [Candidatus Riflebacteria bacterium RBG_13_59_9]
MSYHSQSGMIAKISAKIAKADGSIGSIDLIEISNDKTVRDLTIDCTSEEHARKVIKALQDLPDVQLISVYDDTFRMHVGGKLEVVSRVPLKTRADLSMAYTPGVGRVCTAIHDDYKKSFQLTIRRGCIAIVSDGSAVLGLGNIGAAAAMPVMEGKAILFKEFGNVDAFPLCIDTQDPEEVISFCKWVAPTFGGINLEDISSPRCFYIEEQLKKALDIPVFHDDQHGTAVVVVAGLINALKITGWKQKDMKAAVCGAGAASIAVTKFLMHFGVRNIVMCDRQGAIHRGREFPDNPAKQWAAENTNPQQQTGSIHDVVADAHMFLGLSGPGVLDENDLKKMHPRPIIFAMSNPVPEIMPEIAAPYASVMVTGRSDYPNQVNNALAFPGIFRGALDARASDINEEMKHAAAEAIAGVVKEEELSPDYIIPSVFNKKVARNVGRAVAQAAHKTGVARRVLRNTSIYHI